MNTRFFSRLLIYLLPIGIYLGSTTSTAIYAGEYLPLQQVITQQTGEQPVLYGRAYRDNYFSYKLLSTLYRQPEVLAVGSSRTQQYRSMFFDKKSAAFYNAGQAAQSIYDMQQFIASLDKDHLPKVLILGLDQPWFNAASHYSQPAVSQVLDDETSVDPMRAMHVSSDVLADLVDGKINLSRLTDRHEPVYKTSAIGFNAIMNGMGFRNDGSYQYGDDIQNPPSNDERLAEAFDDIAQNLDSHFVAGDEVSQQALDTLDSILQFGKAHGITIIGFAPPYAPSVYQRMMADGNHTYIAKEVQAIQVLFNRYGYVYFDFSDASALGATDDDMIDGFHASEFIYLRMYLHMLNQLPLVLGQYSDPQFLQPLAQERPASRFELFGNRF